MSNATVNLEKAGGHQVLAAAGKTILRPGGRTGTEQLFRWADFKAGDTVLELASSFGYSAIALAQRFNVQVVGVEKNPESVARARANIQAAGLQNQVQIIEGDIFDLDSLNQKFDCVFAEAILSMQSAPGKAKILQQIRNCLKPGGKFLSHELLAQNHEEEIRQELGPLAHTNTTPISETKWQELYEQTGLKVQEYKTGPIALLNLPQNIKDEGILPTLKIVWNVLTKPFIRRRVLTMRRVFKKYQNDLGYIVLCAVAE